ncbi:MAG: FAD-binding oxidoreductase, partial [Candidatus Electrothrix sp. EH2]|nr:FAD-binding oxidoreductase [Candidatus Electrothrix sp. EH2]
GRMNRILDFSEELAYITVEAGVTQQQLAEYLQEKGANLFMSMTGGPPDASLMGNALERGIGKGPYGDKFNHVCGLEVVLPTGECIHTGFERFENAKTAKIHRWGVGPYLDGLFTQSGLGIVTRMTLWLHPISEHFQTFYYTVKDDAKLDGLIDALRHLKLTGIIRGTFVIANDYRILTMQPYPWTADGKAPGVPFPPEILKKSLGGAKWAGEGALYSVSRKHGQAERQYIKQLLKNHVDKLVFVDRRKAFFYKWAAPLYKRFKGIEVNMDSLFYRTIHRGVPSDAFSTLGYWKKRIPVPADKDLDQDGCGLLWCAPAVPMQGTALREALTLIEMTLVAHQFEFNVGLNCFSERCMDITIGIIYDRDVDGEDQRAMDCYETLWTKLNEAGYIPYRAGIQSMHSFPPVRDDYQTLLNNVKNTLDPNCILAPGRYL